MAESFSWTWHSSTLSLWLLSWEICFSFGSSYHLRAFIFSFGSMLPTPFSVADVFKGSHSIDICYDILKHSFHVCCSWTSYTLMSFCLESYNLFHVTGGGYIKALLRWVTTCRNELIIQEFDWENLAPVPWGLHTSMEIFLTLCDMFSSFSFNWHVLCGVWIQLIHSHHTDCTVVPWESLTSLVVSLASINGLHHCLEIRWCLPCLTSALFSWLVSYARQSSEWDIIPQI